MVCTIKPVECVIHLISTCCTVFAVLSSCVAVLISHLFTSMDWFGTSSVDWLRLVCAGSDWFILCAAVMTVRCLVIVILTTEKCFA